MKISKEFAQEIKTLSALEKLRRALRYKGVGFIGEVSEREDSESGKIWRNVQILTASNVSLLALDSSDELNYFSERKGSKCRLSGALIRMPKTVSAKLLFEPDQLILPGDHGWVEPTDAEIETGFEWDGFGKVLQRKSGDYRGETYRNIQFGVVGDTHKISKVPKEVFDKVPEDGMIAMIGNFRYNIGDTRFGSVAFMYPHCWTCWIAAICNRPPRLRRRRKPLDIETGFGGKDAAFPTVGRAAFYL